MQPTLRNGSIVIADQWKEPHAGDIVVAYSEKYGGRIIKRVVAEGGDSVGMEKGKLILNQDYVEESYLSESYRNLDGSWDAVEVPVGMFFLLGDNREQSADSRKFGCVGESEIKGTVIFTVFQ